MYKRTIRNLLELALTHIEQKNLVLAFLFLRGIEDQVVSEKDSNYASLISELLDLAQEKEAKTLINSWLEDLESEFVTLRAKDYSPLCAEHYPYNEASPGTATPAAERNTTIVSLENAIIDLQKIKTQLLDTVFLESPRFSNKIYPSFHPAANTQNTQMYQAQADAVNAAMTSRTNSHGPG